MEWKVRVGWKGSIWERERTRDSVGGAYVTYVHILVLIRTSVNMVDRELYRHPVFHRVYPSVLAEFASAAFFTRAFSSRNGINSSALLLQICYLHLYIAF